MSKTLSVFIDESGDFGPYSKFSNLYIIGFVFHDQENSISEQIVNLKTRLQYLGISEQQHIHTLPIIRGEKGYENVSREVRSKTLTSIASFMRNCDIKTSTILVDKKLLKNNQKLEDVLQLKINEFINQNIQFFKKYDYINLYYDSGQKKLTKLLNDCFKNNLYYVRYTNIEPRDYFLFQVADFLCALRLLKYKYPNLTKRELWFFKNLKTLKKGYLKLLNIKQL